jgi:tetratricopeptide (TPR) repeat protein
MNTRTEELYLEGENAIKNGNILEAKQSYETILLDDPHCYYAHNSLGWIYKTQFDDYKKAENHYKAAIKFGPSYPHAYYNLIYLLSELERFEELEHLLQGCLQVPVLDKSLIYTRLGLLEEMKENLGQAIVHYKRAIKLCLIDEKIEEIKKNIARCEYKSEME